MFRRGLPLGAVCAVPLAGERLAGYKDGHVIGRVFRDSPNPFSNAKEIQMAKGNNAQKKNVKKPKKDKAAKVKK